MCNHEEKHDCPREVFNDFGITEIDNYPDDLKAKNFDYAANLYRQQPDLTTLKRYQLSGLIWYLECHIDPNDPDWYEPSVQADVEPMILMLYRCQMEYLRRLLEKKIVTKL